MIHTDVPSTPPSIPFYKEKNGKKRYFVCKEGGSPEFLAKLKEIRKRVYKEQLAKPVEQRIGKLKTFKDMTAEEKARLLDLYAHR